ncbi:MAG: hypothetical protein JSV61_03185 [Anaerolineales bacterium]|nr:MAG: hypothetical protein JSV61_03185 [Anaerolineales bacterium]
MLAQESTQSNLSISKAFRAICLVSGTFAVLMILLSVAAYLPDHPDFSPFTTFLSDIGDTPGWPQVIFNSGTLIVAPLRYMVLILLVLQMYQLGAGRAFGNTVLVIGALATFGTILMTAVPFSVGPTIHKLGIPLYFFGVVPMQIVIGLKEWSLKDLPRVLPVVSFSLAGAYLVFFVLMILYELDVVSRTTTVTPMIWQWLGFSLSILWVYTHGLILGKK